MLDIDQSVPNLLCICRSVAGMVAKQFLSSEVWHVLVGSWGISFIALEWLISWDYSFYVDVMLFFFTLCMPCAPEPVPFLGCALYVLRRLSFGVRSWDCLIYAVHPVCSWDFSFYGMCDMCALCSRLFFLRWIWHVLMILFLYDFL